MCSEGCTPNPYPCPALQVSQIRHGIQSRQSVSGFSLSSLYLQTLYPSRIKDCYDTSSTNVYCFSNKNHHQSPALSLRLPLKPVNRVFPPHALSLSEGVSCSHCSFNSATEKGWSHAAHLNSKCETYFSVQHSPTSSICEYNISWLLSITRVCKTKRVSFFKITKKLKKVQLTGKK